MDIGTIFLTLGIFALIADLIFLFTKNLSQIVEKYKKIPGAITLYLTNISKITEKYKNIPLIISSFFVILSFSIFISSLIFLDFSYKYAYNHVSEEMDIFLRIASTWSGQAGSYFLWGMYVFILYLIFRISFRRHIASKIYQRIFAIFNFNAISLLVLVLINEPFSRLDPAPAIGLGLNPILNTFWNVIHPPVILLAYSLFLIPFAVSLSRLSLGETNYNDTTEIVALRRFSMALSWLVITTGLSLGAYWAYVTLGWGGFWAWDPVETSSLVPWIFATIFFHSSPSTKEKPINFDKDFLAILPFLSILFATLVTRSGFLDSVHTFVSTPLIIVLEIYIIIIIFIIVLVTVRSKNIQLFHSWEFLKTMSIQELALYVAYLSILMGAAGILFGLVIPFGIAILPEPYNQSLIVDQKFFNSIIGMFGFVALISTFFMDFMYPKSIKYKVYSVFFIVFFGLFLAILSFLKFPLSLSAPFSILYSIFGFLITTSYLANLIIPIALFSMISALIGIIFIYRELKLTRIMKIRRFSQTILHLGILIALVGALYSSNLTEVFTQDIALGEEMNLSTDGSLKLKFTQTEYDNTSNLYTGIINNKYEITKNNNTIGEGWIRIGRHKIYGWFSDVSIVPTIFEDVYITILFSNDQDFTSGYVEFLKFQVHLKPMIWLLWVGVILIIVSMIPLVIISFRKLKNQYIFSHKMESTLNIMSDNILT